MGQGSTQPLTEMSTKNKHLLGGKWGRSVRLTTLPPSCAVVMKSGNLNFLEPSGPLRACNGTDLPFFYISVHALVGRISHRKCLSSPCTCHEDVWVSGTITPIILKLDTRRWVVSFTPRLLYLRGPSTLWTLCRRQGGPKSGSGRFG